MHHTFNLSDRDVVVFLMIIIHSDSQNPKFKSLTELPAGETACRLEIVGVKLWVNLLLYVAVIWLI